MLSREQKSRLRVKVRDNAVCPAVPLVADRKSDMETKWELETEDFRRSAPKLTFHRGKIYRMRVCDELIGGRWEGFVSMEPVSEPTSIQ
jgi:hypothetical protein